MLFVAPRLASQLLFLNYRLILSIISCFTSIIFFKLVNELSLFLLSVSSQNIPKNLSVACCGQALPYMSKRLIGRSCTARTLNSTASIVRIALQKGGVPATPSGTATLLRLSPSYQFCPRSLLAVTNFRHPQLPWLDGRCVQGPGTYSPRHG